MKFIFLCLDTDTVFSDSPPPTDAVIYRIVQANINVNELVRKSNI